MIAQLIADPRGAAAVSQEALFETDPPPWELTLADDVTVARVVLPRAPMGRSITACRPNSSTRCGRG